MNDKAWFELLVSLKDQCAITWAFYKEADDREEQKRMAGMNEKFDAIYFVAMEYLLQPWKRSAPCADFYIEFGAYLIGEMHALSLTEMPEEILYSLMLPYAIAYGLWEGSEPEMTRHDTLVQRVSVESMKLMEDFCEKHMVTEFDY